MQKVLKEVENVNKLKRQILIYEKCFQILKLKVTKNDFEQSVCEKAADLESYEMLKNSYPNCNFDKLKEDPTNYVLIDKKLYEDKSNDISEVNDSTSETVSSNNIDYEAEITSLNSKITEQKTLIEKLTETINMLVSNKILC